MLERKLRKALICLAYARELDWTDKSDNIPRGSPHSHRFVEL
jgi:hypothetical protein